MIVSNKDMVAVDVKAARTENCKDGSVDFINVISKQ